MKPELSFEGAGREHSRQRELHALARGCFLKGPGGMVLAERQKDQVKVWRTWDVFCLHPKRLGSRKQMM